MSTCSPWCLKGSICSTCVHYQIHLHYMCKIDSQAVWPNFPVFWIVDPIKPPKMPPWGIVGRIVFSLCSFPDESTEVYQIRCKSVQPFDSFLRLLNVWPPNPPRHAPWGIEERLVFSLYPFPDESADVNQSWCQSVQPFDSIPWPLIVWPPKPPKCPPCVSRGNLFGVYPFPDDSTNVVPIGPAVWIFPWFLNVWPPNPPPPNVEGRIVFSLYPFPDESADVYQIWCQSVEPFDSLPNFGFVPHTPPPRNAPLCLEVHFVWHISIPRWICTCVPHLVSIGPAVW